MSTSELGAFLRVRREHTAPASVGLPTGMRRRTPGLRRAEVATLAGVSVEYLTRLEQGRDRNPSAQILGALADALRMSIEDRIHLRYLGKAGAGMMCPAGVLPARSVRPTVQALLDRLEPGPALVMNRLGDVIAATTGYRRLAGPAGLLDGPFDGVSPNLIRFTFTDPRSRVVFPDWERVADAHAAQLKAEVRRGDPHAAEFADDLAVIVGTPFTERMAASVEPPARTGVDRFRHPDAGELRLAYEILDLPDADEQRLIVHFPTDAATTAALDRVIRRQPGALWAVPSRSEAQSA